MSCKEVKTKKYQTRKSPAFHAGDCKGQTKQGKDGMYVSKADKRGVFHWKKLGSTRRSKQSSVNHTRKSKRSMEYLTHDNGARAFRVVKDGSSVHIYRADSDKRIKTYKANEMYVGKSSGKTTHPVHSVKNAKNFDGNTMLIDLGKKKFVFVGTELYEFEMEDDVDAYYSLVGNNDVPYPVLLGTEYVYFMLDHTYVPRSAFETTMTRQQWEDAYKYYYGYVDAKTGKKPNDSEHGGLEKQAKKMKKFHLAVKHIII